MERLNERKDYLDSIRFIAIFMVFLTHYINRFGDQYRYLFHDMPSSIFLYGISGKMGVAILAVMMGMIAYRTKRGFEDAMFHRYVFFFISVILINTAYVIWNHISVSENLNVIGFMKAGLLLEYTYFPALWFVRDFFIAYFISILNQRANVKIGGVLLEILILLVFSEVWIAVCLLGNIAAILENTGLIKEIGEYRWVTIALLLFAWLITKLPAETNPAFVAYGISCVVLLLITSCNYRVRRIFSMRWLAWLGRFSWGFFLIHALVYNVIGTCVFHLEEHIGAKGYGWLFTGCLFFCTICNIILSVPVTKLINWLTNTMDIALRHIVSVVLDEVREKLRFSQVNE